MKRIARAGFTLVELIVVIAVIGILVTIVTVGYPAWRTNTIQTTMKSDLQSLASAMEERRNVSDQYPTTIPSGFTASGDNTVQLVGASSTYYCANISNASLPGVVYSYDSDSQDVQTSSC